MKKSKVKTKNKYNIIYIAMITFSVLLIVGAGTYAYYQSTITGTISGTIATWSFKANNQTTTMNLNLGSVYPGKVATHNIVLSAGSGVAVYYEIFFNIPSSASSYASYLYWDSAYTSRVGRCSNHVSYPGTYGYYGVIQAGQTKTITLYFNMPYEVVHSYTTNREQYTLTINARQYTGYTGILPMKLNGNTYTYTAIDSTTGWITGNC